MAIRTVIQFGDDRLQKKCHEVTKIDSKIISLLDDMAETMKSANGVGLAAPQVGILRRVAVIDVGEGLIELINPKIIKMSKETIDDLEGCLSFPGKYGYVERPKFVTVKATDRNGKEFKIRGEDLLARALCHEIEHLDGILYTTHVTRFAETEDGQ